MMRVIWSVACPITSAPTSPSLVQQISWRKSFCSLSLSFSECLIWTYQLDSWIFMQQMSLAGAGRMSLSYSQLGAVANCFVTEDWYV